jgi:hypothetical protein
MKSTSQIVSVAILFGSISAATALAATRTAASCNAADVQAAMSSAAAGDTVIIPAGTCTWTTQISWTPPANITLQGAGNQTTVGGGDATVIIDSYSSSRPLLSITTGTAASTFRLSGITFQGGSTGTGNDKYDGMVALFGSSLNIRVDHTHFNTTTYSPSTGGSELEFQGCVGGVTDHSIFDQSPGGTNNAVRLYNGGTCNSDSLGVGDQSWTMPTALGTSNFMFVENNIFNSGSGNDCTKGGRYVWRFNTMNMTAPAPAVQTHPTGGGQRERGCRAIEIYENTATAQPGNYINAFFWISSGTGVVWGNTLPSSSASGGTGYRTVISAHNMRSDNSTYTQAPTPNGWGYCGTAFNGVGSAWDQNSSATTGYACLDQVGRGAGQLLINDFPNVVNSTTGTIAWPHQALEPVYEWMDAYSPVPNNPSGIWSQNGPDDTQNIDYYVGTTNSGSPISFNGTTGVGAGTLASRPATCTTGVAYWATDQGSWNTSGSGPQGVLYRCSAPNTWTAYYTPYTYPHPLVSGPTGLSAPSSPTATVH